MLGQQRQDRRRRVPDADPPLGQEVAEPAGILAQRLADQYQSRRVAAGGEQVEHRQVEMQGRVRGKPVIVRPGTERVPAPIQEGQRVGVREHDPLGLAGRARGEEDVRQVVLGERGGQRRGGVVGHDFGPVRIAECDRARRRGRLAGDDQPGQGTSAGPGLAEGRRRLGGDDHRLDARGGQDPGGTCGGPVGSTGT